MDKTQAAVFCGSSKSKFTVHPLDNFSHTHNKEYILCRSFFFANYL